MACSIMCSTDFNELCRLCAAKTSVLLGLHIFDSEGNTRQIFKKIQECLPVQITCTDRLPKMICEECVYKLDLLFEFREKSVKTESFLEGILKTNKAVSPNSVEAVCSDQVDQILHETCNVNTSLSDSLLPQNIHVNSNDASDNILHSVVQVQESLQATVTDALPDTVLGVVASSLRDDLHTNVNEILNESLVESVHSETQAHENSNVRNDPIESTNCSRIKCEPDIFIKDEGWACGASESDSDEDNDITTQTQDALCEENLQDTNTNENNIEILSEPVEISNRVDVKTVENKETDVHEGVPSQFMNPAANSLLMLSCPQPTESQEPDSSWMFCSICGKSLNKNIDFQAHYETHYNKCSACGALFGTEDALLSHCMEAHPVPKENPQPQITEEFTSVSIPEPVSTVAASVPSEPSPESKSPSKRKKWEPKVCKECGKEYRTNYKLAEHMRKHTGEKPFQCSICPKAFRSKIGLAQHEAKHTGQFDYTCNTCGKGFQCKSYLIVHQRVHSDHKPYPCTTCGRNFKTKQALLDHHNRHLGVKPYVCETCGRRFITKGLCKSHQRVHSGEDNKQYPCSVCNKMFVSKSYLTTHLRIHTGEKPFMCEVCGKGFLTRVDLRIHSTIHTGEKSFVCEWCGKAFARRDALRCHRRSHTGERPYSCDVCGQSFTQFSPLTIHKRLHTGERPYVCDVCNKAFVSRSTMTSHRKKHHP